MAKTLSNCCYDKIKLLHELSKCLWFIERHAEGDAKEAGHQEFHKLLDVIEADLEKHVRALHDLDCGCK